MYAYDTLLLVQYPKPIKYLCHRYWRGTSHIGNWYYKQWYMRKIAKPLGLKSYRYFIAKKRRINKRHQRGLYGNRILHMKPFRKKLTCDHCGICQRSFGEKDTITLDHILPKEKYPQLVYDIRNMQLAHDRCNSLKGNNL